MTPATDPAKVLCSDDDTGGSDRCFEGAERRWRGFKFFADGIEVRLEDKRDRHERHLGRGNFCHEFERSGRDRPDTLSHERG